MKVYYWSPHTSYVATIKAVYNSALSLTKYNKENLIVKIINANGEWDSFINKSIILVNLGNKSLLRTYPRVGYFLSRFSYLYIFLKCFFPLKKLLKKEKPDYLLIHLITLLPIMLLIFFKFETKFILRISGYPRLNFFRKIIWKLASKKIHLVTAPTLLTLDYIKSQNIFDEKKIIFLPDPVYQIREMVNQKNELVEEYIDENKKYIISIGRLTKQKNFSLLIKAFNEIRKNNDQFKLLIIGEGEEKKNLELLIANLNLKNDIIFLGFKENVFKYIKLSNLVLSTSLWEDPGFFLIESGILNKPIISSDCPNGPSELLSHGLGGYLFKNNQLNSLVDVFKKFTFENDKKIKDKIFFSKKKFRQFSIFGHYKILKNIIK
ncbi:RfaG Glycosyltransferase [Candidatus Pelagibacterales bacterium]|jgi:glycosyltransferase involved in cell wall biosynthesis